jgi:2,3-dihydroxybenzoate-AMP ligase
MLPGGVPWPEEFARRYRSRGYWEGITLFEMLRRSAARWPEKIAVVDGERRCSYAELALRAEDRAAGYRALGLRPLERVIFQLANGLDFLLSLFGLLRAGVIPVMALPAHRQSEIGHWTEHARAVAHFVPASTERFDYLRLAREVAAEHSSVRHIVVAGQPPGARAAALAEPAADEVALMLLSGGTTGVPKLIPRTHDDYLYNARQTSRVAGFGPDTVFLAVLPMGHNYTLACPGVLGTLSQGGTVVIAGAATAEIVFPTIERERVTAIGATVPLVARWLEADLFARYDLSSLRLFINGGAKLPPELRRRVEERFGCEYQENFGCGEGLINMTRPGDPQAVRHHSSGRPVSEADEVRVVDEQGRDVPSGAVGELITRGPYTIRGYYDAPEANRASFTADGFYRMGDIARVVDGYIYLEGRRKDLINRGGEKISCEEIEDYILAHPKVMSVCVVAMPDPVFGEKACAFAIPREGCSLELQELVSFLEARNIARFKLPERLELVSEFPISPAGKILRRALRARIAAALGAKAAG